jgi:RecA-family ATPase
MNADAPRLLDAALSYAARGWHVFPCTWIDGGACSCHDVECDSPGKHPLTPHGLLDATNDAELVRDYWTKLPKANIAIATGEKSGIVAVDIDDPELAKAELRKVLPAYDFKAVPLQKTGKGWHLIFSHPGEHVKTCEKFLPGMDCRGDGGYMMAAPSIHFTGKHYEWKVPLNGAMPPLPAALLSVINGPATPNGTGEKPRLDTSIIWEGISEGQRDSQLFRYACLMRHNDTPRDLAERLIVEAAARCKPPFLDRDALRKVEQAYKYPATSADHANGNGYAARDAITDHFVKASSVTPKKLRWLWHSRIPLGKVTILDGDPGLGKSLLSIEFAACLSTARPMPNAAAADITEAAGAVFLSAEDDTEDTIQPRLALAGADLDKIAVRKVGDLYMPTIADLEVIRAAVKLVDAKLVVIDPLMAFLPAETNSYRDQDIRRSLAPLAALAAELGVAILVIRHLNKTSNSNPIYRGGGSIGIIGAARSGLMVAKDPDDEARFILSVAKSNLAKLPASLAYEIRENAAEIPWINWLGPTHHTASSLLHDQADSEEERSAVKDAEEFLTDYLKDPRKATDVLKASRAAGIAEKTLRRAKNRLKVYSGKSDFNSDWFWSFTKMANSHEDGQSEDS